MIRLISSALVVAALALGCSDNDEMSATANRADSADTTTTTEPVPTTTEAELTAECLGLFEQHWDAYGWEQCILGRLAYAEGAESGSTHALELDDAALLLWHVWDRYGSGSTPTFVAQSNIEHYCEGGSFCASLIGGSRYIAVDTDYLPTINALGILHETAHHMIGVGRDTLGGGHGEEFRCAAIELYATYAPDLVPAHHLRQYREACGITDYESCSYDLTILLVDVRAEYLAFAEIATGIAALGTPDEIRARMRGVEANWQGDTTSKAARMAELEAELAAIELAKAAIELDKDELFSQKVEGGC